MHVFSGLNHAKHGNFRLHNQQLIEAKYQLRSDDPSEFKCNAPKKTDEFYFRINITKRIETLITCTKQIFL